MNTGSENNETRWRAQEDETLAAIDKRRLQLQAEKIAEANRVETLANIKSQRQELRDSGMTDAEIDALADELAAAKSAEVRETLERAREGARLAAGEPTEEQGDDADREADADLKERDG